MAVKDMNIEDLFADLGIDLSDEDISETEDSGFSSLYDIENPNSAIRRLEQDFEKNFIILMPVYLRIPFNPATGKRLPKGKFFSTASVDISPDDLVRSICKKRKEDLEYRENVDKILSNSKKVYNIDYDPVTGALNEDATEAFSPYINPYAVSESTQRYKINEDKTITRLAIMPTNDYGVIQFDQVDPRIAVRHRIESALMAEEIAQVKKEMTAEGKLQKEIEDRIKEIKSGKSVTSPRILNIYVGYSFRCDSGGTIISEEVTKYNDESVSLASTLRYFQLNQDNLKTVLTAFRSNSYPSINYIPFLYSMPAKSAEVPNLGVACSKVAVTSIGVKCLPNKQISELDNRVNELLTSSDSITVERIKQSANKFGPIDIEDVIACYTNGFSSYKRALSNKAFIANNIALLKEVKDDLGLAEVESIAEANKTVLEIEPTSVTSEFVDDNELEEYYDSDDIRENKSEVSAEDFL